MSATIPYAKRVSAAVLFVAAGLLAACGGSDPPTVTIADPSATVADPTEDLAPAVRVAVTLREEGMPLSAAITLSSSAITEEEGAAGVVSQATTGTESASIVVEVFDTAASRQSESARREAECRGCAAVAECGPILVQFRSRSAGPELSQEVGQAQTILEASFAPC